MLLLIELDFQWRNVERRVCAEKNIENVFEIQDHVSGRTFSVENVLRSANDFFRNSLIQFILIMVANLHFLLVDVVTFAEGKSPLAIVWQSLGASLE